MELIVPVHQDLLKQFCQSRELNTRYQTNKLIKLVSAYYVLKSLSSSGILKDYARNMYTLCSHLNCTEPTLRRILKGCQKLGYLRVTAGSIRLISFAEFTQLFDSTTSSMVRIRYNCQVHKFHSLVETVYMQLQEQERARVFEKRLQALPELLRELKGLVIADNKGNYRKSLELIQLQAFKYGHEKKEAIFALNPFTTCNSKTLRKMFNFKSEQSVAYLKAKLQAQKLARISAQRVLSQERQRLSNRYMDWDQRTQQTIWVQPDRWEYAPILTT